MSTIDTDGRGSARNMYMYGVTTVIPIALTNRDDAKLTSAVLMVV